MHSPERFFANPLQAFDDSTSSAPIDSAATPSPGIVLSPEVNEKLCRWFDEEGKAKIVVMYQTVKSKPNTKPSALGQVQSKPIARELRGSVHECIRQVFESRLDSVGNHDGIVTVTALPQGSTKHTRKHGQARPAKSIFRDEGEYLYLSLYKENKDTMEVTNFMAKVLKIKPHDIGHAGTKDRRAATTQRLSIRRQTMENVDQICNWALRGAYVSNFSYHKQPLELGELQGNRFIISLRDVEFEGFTKDMDIATKQKIADEFLTTRIESFREQGFINYFGLQRFGSHAVGTDDIGLLILQDNFKGAVDAILTFDSGLLTRSEEYEERDKINRDDVDRAMAISEFRRTGTSKYAMSNMPRRFMAEQTIIQHLSKNGKDFVGALLRINRNTRTMYVHAYQSRVWNAAASARYEQFGAKVVEGDLVIVDKQAEKAALRDEVDENGEVVVHPAAEDTAVNPDDIYQRARPLTAEEAQSGKYTIFDIVLPTPGFDVKYPDNKIGEWYKEYMASERGGNLDPANMRRSNRDFSLSGSYRPLMGKVSDMTFETRTYYGLNTQLVDTELDTLRKTHPGVVEKKQPPRPDTTSTQLSRAPRRAQTPAQLAALKNEVNNAQAKLASKSNVMAAWGNASATIMASDKALAKKSEDDLARAKAEGRIVAPAYKDTFRPTGANGTCKVTGEEIVEMIEEEQLFKEEHAPEQVKVEDASEVEAAPEKIIKEEILGPVTPLAANSVPEPINGKRDADNISKSNPPSPRSWDGTPEPARLAVILAFSLGTSQYATMALRELMRSDGVRAFQPEYFSRR